MDPNPEPPARRGHPLIAWVVIVALVGLIAFLPQLSTQDPQCPPEGSSDQVLLEIQGKYLVGAVSITNVPGEQLYNESRELDGGPVWSRLRFVVVAGELAGPEEALERLSVLREELEQEERKPEPEQERVMSTLDLLYGDFGEERWTAPSVGDEERSLLERRLGWFGELALAPAAGPDGARRSAVMAPARLTVWIIFAALCIGGLMLLAGVAGLIVFFVQAVRGALRWRFGPASPNGRLYAETFAIWLVLFTGLSLATAFVPVSGRWSMMLNLAASVGSLAALGWPLLRRVPWSRVRHEIGWTAPRPLIEPLWGVLCYFSTLPLLAIGVVIMLLILALQQMLTGAPGPFDSAGQPAHPIVEWIAAAGLEGRIQIMVLACVVAPIIEETMFRGVLYRHLRDATAGWRVALSVLFSTLANGFIFAAIHPQGWVAVPVLMALAFGFSIAREWRGSLLAPITAHSLNNGLVLGLLLLLVA